MKNRNLLFAIICLFLTVSIHAQYTNYNAWGIKYNYNGSDYPNSFLKLKVAVANPRISGTGNKVVFYDSDGGGFNSIEVKSVFQSSDARLKTNINSLNKGLGTILQLNPVSFNWKSDKQTLSVNPEKKSLGFLAQDVAKCIPEIVTLSSTGDSLVDYTAIIPILVQAIKEQNATIQLLETKVDELNSKIISSEFSQLSSDNSELTLEQNYPNPVESSTTISFNIPQNVRNAYITICDLQGNKIKEYPIASREKGSLMISASDFQKDGMYLYSLIIDDKLVSTKRMYVSR